MLDLVVFVHDHAMVHSSACNIEYDLLVKDGLMVGIIGYCVEKKKNC